MAKRFAGESSSTAAKRGKLQDECSTCLDGDRPTTPHQIFLSHSGKQKGFAKDLYDFLRTHDFTTFFDIKYHSLPAGENFPEYIHNACTTCKVGLVVLSDEFVRSKWPMLELCTLVDARLSSGVKVIPLFYKLAPSDLKEECNLENWSKEWEAHAQKDQKFDISKCASALEFLDKQNGIKFKANEEGEYTYLKRIVDTISNSQFNMVPPIEYDTSKIRGRDRLRQVILDKFKEMESRHQQGAQSEVTCLLGIYGLPGSGKSTMCKCLRNYFSPCYGGKSLYLDLPTSPSQADLARVFKQLLQLTDFRNRSNLDRITDFDEVVPLLKKHEFRQCRFFLVVDNISEESREYVKRILVEAGIGLCSKVVLVARTLDILQKLLCFQEREPPCVCDSMGIPNINEEEATDILLQQAARADVYLTPKQRDISSRTVRMCGFGEGDSLVYLPLVMERMGVSLMNYHGDFEGWGHAQARILRRVKMWKKDAVKELVKNSFEMLCRELQLLFLDVALFIVPSKFGQIHEVYSVLSLLHGTETEEMEDKVKYLQRQCFLRVTEEFNISVHDVYLEFASSIQEGFMGGWCWQNRKYLDAESPARALMLNGEETMLGEQKQVRTMILEVGKDCMKVDLQSFSSLKAVFVKDCKSLVSLGVAGLNSLVSLDIESCSSFLEFECRDSSSRYTSLLNVRRLRIEEHKVCWAPQCEEEPLRFWDDMFNKYSYTYRCELEYLAGKQPFNVGIVEHMRWLQVLRLERTGIRRLVGMSSFWPQLKDVRIIEPFLEAFEVGNLPLLESFIFGGHGVVDLEGFTIPCICSDIYNVVDKGLINSLHGKDLLRGCSNLQEVSITCSSFEADDLGTLPPNLKILRLNCLYSATELPDFESSAHSLEELVLKCCEEVQWVDLDVGFTNLIKLVLCQCHRIDEVNGLDSLPSLQTLDVHRCSSLESLVGFHKSSMLETLIVDWCPELKKISCLSALTSLEKVQISYCPHLPSLEVADIENLRSLQELRCSLKARSGPAISLRNLGNLKSLHLKLEYDEMHNETLTGHDQTRRLYNLDVSLLQGLDDLPLPSIGSLKLENVYDLAGIDGIQRFLTSLTKLELWSLENLRTLKGIETLIHLTSLWVLNAPLLEEVPSLHKLVNVSCLTIQDCPKLTAVIGCNEMRFLRWAKFDGCVGMAELPVNDTRLRNLGYLSFQGCGFARNNIEAMAAIVGDREAPTLLWTASLRQLASEVYPDVAKLRVDSSLKEKVVEALFPRLLHRFLPNDDDCIDFPGVEEKLMDAGLETDNPLPEAAMRQLECRLERKPKKELLQHFQTYKPSLHQFLEDTSDFFSNDDTLERILAIIE